MTYEDRIKVSKDHKRRAELRRAEATKMGPDDPRYNSTMLLVGFHTIQSALWKKVADRNR